MKALKVGMSILVLLVAVAAGIIFYGLGQVNSFVEKMIEKTGSELTQTRVAVGSVDIRLTEGKGAINQLSIANPSGYSNNNLLLASSIGLTIDIQSVTAPVKVIKLVSIGEIALLAEQKNIKDTNIQALLNNIKAANTSTPSAKSNDKASDVRLMIEKITVATSSIDLQTQKLGQRKVTLPAFTLSNIGNKKTGLTPEQAAKIITQQIMDKVKVAVKAELSGLLKDEAKDKLKEKLQDKLKSELSTDKLKSLFK